MAAKDDQRPNLVQSGDKVVGVTAGKDGNIVEITDAAELSRLRDLVKKRRDLGIEISRRLQALGQTSLSHDEPTRIIHR